MHLPQALNISNHSSNRADPDVAMYAVDTLRQLAHKLLARAELARFTTQAS